MNIRLVAFDMDGTLTREPSSWLYLINRTGVEDIAMKGKSLYQTGKISYKAWGDMVIDAWNEKGLLADDIEKMLDGIEIINGVEETFRQLQDKAYRTAVISTGPKRLFDRIAEKASVDYAYVNDIRRHGSRMLDYDVRVNDHEKVLYLREICRNENTPLTQVCFVGNDMNDRECMESSGYSIALNAVSAIKDIASVSLETNDLRAILDYL